MNILISTIFLSSLSSFIAFCLLIFFSGSSPVAAGVASLVSAALGAMAIALSRRRDRELARIGESAAKKAREGMVPSEIKPLLSAIRTRLSDAMGDGNDLLVSPIVVGIFASGSEAELSANISAAQKRIDRAERVLAALSDRLLTDTLILLPLADGIIKAVPGRTEEAVMSVLEKFMVVREASSHAAASARALRERLDDASGEDSVGRASERSRDAVRDERAVIQELSRSTRENRENLQAMSAEVEAGLDLLKNISEITERSKLIAFNMSIEAARIGDKGRGFKVIIAELHKLNERTFEFSKRVAELLSRIREHTTALVNTMEEKSVAVVRGVESGMDAAESAVESLIHASERTGAFTKEIALMSESIDHDLDGVLESLQFQDITRQMIEGSVEILAELKKTLAECLEKNEIRIDEARKRDRFNEIRNRLIDAAKTKGEKKALMEVQV